MTPPPPVPVPRGNCPTGAGEGGVACLPLEATRKKLANLAETVHEGGRASTNLAVEVRALRHALEVVGERQVAIAEEVRTTREIAALLVARVEYVAKRLDGVEGATVEAVERLSVLEEEPPPTVVERDDPTPLPVAAVREAGAAVSRRPFALGLLVGLLVGGAGVGWLALSLGRLLSGK